MSQSKKKAFLVLPPNQRERREKRESEVSSACYTENEREAEREMDGAWTGKLCLACLVRFPVPFLLGLPSLPARLPVIFRDKIMKSFNFPVFPVFPVGLGDPIGG
jgi:hypothetical protein